MTGPLVPKHARAAGGPDGGFRGILRELAATRSSSVGVFSDFCRITACCLAMQTREDEYLKTIEGYTPEELDRLAQAMALLIGEMEDHPYDDPLGRHYTEAISSSSQRARGEFYTPPDVSTLMAKVSLDVEQIKADRKPVTLSDPCCGSGSTILACAKLFKSDTDLLRVTMQDINPVACDMAYINTTLWGIPAEVILGDMLRLEQRQRWANIHWYRVGEDQRRRGLQLLDTFRDLTNTPTPTPGTPGNSTGSDPGDEQEAGLEKPPSPTDDDTTPPGPHEQFGLF